MWRRTVIVLATTPVPHATLRSSRALTPAFDGDNITHVRDGAQTTSNSPILAIVRRFIQRYAAHPTHAALLPALGVRLSACTSSTL